MTATVDIKEIKIGDAIKVLVTMENNLTTYVNIAVWFVHEDGTVLKKYALNTLTDHNTDHAIDVTAKSFRIYVEPSVSVTGKEGNYRVIIKTKKTDSVLTGGLVVQSDEYIWTFYEIETSSLTVT